MSFRIVIPARYASERLPGKALIDLGGRPLVAHVHERATRAGADAVVVATDDERVRRAAERFGADVAMTSPAHASGTDRAAEVAVSRGWDAHDVVVNVQGDEPLIPPGAIRQVAAMLERRRDADVATLCVPIADERELADSNAVKVVLDRQGQALYFSRAPVPASRDAAARPVEGLHFRHVGLYAYRVSALERLAATPPCLLERRERLEQLRALWLGMTIIVEVAAEPPPAGVDTDADLERVRRAIEGAD